MSAHHPRRGDVSQPATRSEPRCTTPAGSMPGCDAGVGTAVKFVARELKDIWHSRWSRQSTCPGSDASGPGTASVSHGDDHQIGAPDRPGRRHQ